MGKVTRKRYSAEAKSRVALEAIRGEQALAELASKQGVHVTMIAAWKRQAVEGMSTIFGAKGEAAPAASEADVIRLHAKIGELVVQRDFLAKASYHVAKVNTYAKNRPAYKISNLKLANVWCERLLRYGQLQKAAVPLSAILSHSPPFWFGPS